MNKQMDVRTWYAEATQHVFNTCDAKVNYAFATGADRETAYRNCAEAIAEIEDMMARRAERVA